MEDLDTADDTRGWVEVVCVCLLLSFVLISILLPPRTNHACRQLPYYPDTPEARVRQGPFCCLILLATTPALKRLFSTAPMRFLGR